MSQSYLGGIFRRAAKRLGITTTVIGPAHGRWVHDAPEEPGWEPDVVTDYAPHAMPPEFWNDVDALINIDQGDGFRVIPPKVAGGKPVPCVWTCTEGNENEYIRAAGADAVWSCMPHKPEGKTIPGLLHLNWGFDAEWTPIDAPLGDSARPVDFTLHGSWSDHRTEMVDALRATGMNVAYGPPMSREAWGRSLCEARMTLCDHDGPYLTGRVVDAMAAGCLVLAWPQPCLDMLAPRGYVPVPLRESDNRVDPVALVEIAMNWLAMPDKRREVAERARVAVAGLSWENQLLRVLGSIGVRLPA